MGVSDRLQQFVKEQERNKQLCSSAPQTCDTQPRTPSTSAAKRNTKSAARSRQNSKGRSGAKRGKGAGPVVGDKEVTGGPEDLNQAAGNSSQTLEAEEKEAGSVDPAQCRFLFLFFFFLATLKVLTRWEQGDATQFVKQFPPNLSLFLYEQTATQICSLNGFSTGASGGYRMTIKNRLLTPS